MPKSRKTTEPETEPKPKTARPRSRKKLAEIGRFPFTREVATYRAHLPELLAREGAYVVIRGEEIIGIRDSLGEAEGLGYERFHFTGFMLRKITAVEEVLAFPWPVTY